jgi:hypothetical protein
MLTIKEFCDLHNACEGGREWVLANCGSMPDVWSKAGLDWLLWVATREGVLTDRELRLFACWSARQVFHLMRHEGSKQAIEVAERFANGNATVEELQAARCAAGEIAMADSWSAAGDAADDAAFAVTFCDASDAALEAAKQSARAAARSAARLASRDGICNVAWLSARDAARDAQAQWLRENTSPSFAIQGN